MFARTNWKKAKEAVLRRTDLFDDDPEVMRIIVTLLHCVLVLLSVA